MTDLLPEYDYCIERLLHLRCTACGGWWTLERAQPIRPYHCPWCGVRLAPAQYPNTRTRPASPPQDVPL